MSLIRTFPLSDSSVTLIVQITDAYMTHLHERSANPRLGVVHDIL